MSTQATKHYVGDVGTCIIVDTLVDLTDATSVSLSVKKPDGSVVSWEGTKTQTTKIKYYTIDMDFSIKGTYSLQAVVVMPTGSWRGNTTTFVVTDVFA